MTRTHFSLFSPPLIAMKHVGSQRRRRATLAERVGAPLGHNGAHSPRVTPVDMAAGRLDILRKMHQVHQELPAFPCAKTKCQRACRGRAPALYFRGIFMSLCPK